jgi:copper chaperone CopZ
MRTKKSIMMLLAAFTLACTTVAAQDSTKNGHKKENRTDNRKKATVEEVTFKASMTCENCKAKIERHIAWEKGVKDLDVNLGKKLVTIKYDPSKTSEAALQKAIEALGYTAEKQEAVAGKQ